MKHFVTLSILCLLFVSPHAIAQEELIPPFVLTSSPDVGEEQPLDAPIEIRFDQPMDQRSVERAFAIEPGASADGTFEWLDEQTLRFSMNNSLQRGETYRVRVVESAQSVEGVPLGRPFELRFNTVGRLEVTTVQPSDGASDIAADTSVTVVFNRPVVPLVAIEEMRTLPDPLIFTPQVEGEGEWLNTSIYRFTPTDGFQPATTYSAVLREGLTDAAGLAELDRAFEWQFTTVSPKVIGSIPRAGDLYVSPTPVISIAFNQPMDRADVEANFRLFPLFADGEAGASVPNNEYFWTEGGLPLPQDNSADTYYDYAYDEGDGPEQVGVEVLTVIPGELLSPGETYRAFLPAGTAGAVSPDAQMEQDFSANFTVAPFPEIESTYPQDGATHVPAWQNFQINFNTPMNPASIKLGETIFISPPVSATRVYSYWWRNNTRFELSLPSQASSEYEVVLGPGLESRAGFLLDGVEVVRWQTAASDPTAYLNSAGRVSVYNAYTDTLAYVTVRNLSRVDLRLYRLDPNDFIEISDNWSAWYDFAPSGKDLLASWSQPITATVNSNVIYEIDLADALGEPVEPSSPATSSGDESLPEPVEGNRLSPGLYYLEVIPPSDAVYPEAEGYDYFPEPDRRVIAVTNHNLTVKSSGDQLLTWLTDLQTGQPVSDVPITAILGGYERTPTPLGEMTTGEDGIAVLDHDSVEDIYDTRYVIAGEIGSDDFAISASGWDDGISRWQFNNVSVEDYRQPYAAELYTERGVYRPGQTVYFKGILRADDDSRYSVPTAVEAANVTVYDGQGKEILQTELPVSEMGTLHGDIELAESAGLGQYSIEIEYDDYVFSESFLVTAYRLPEYQVSAVTDNSEYAPGETVQLMVEASFFSGGPVSNADVEWTLLSDDRPFIYTPPSGGPTGRFDFTDYDFSRETQANFYQGVGVAIAEGSGTTDLQGRFMVEVEADIADKISSQRFTFDVTIEDLNDQLVAAQASAVVHKGLVYVGLQPTRYVGRAGEENQVNVLTVDWDSQPVGDVEVQVVFMEHNWYSVQRQYEDGSFYWDSVVEDVPVFTTTVSTGENGLTQADFTPEQGGIYKVLATATDDDGNEVRSSAYMWVSGANYVNWRQENNDRLELVTDKREYNVGDTATILLPHPYNRPVQALITLERGEVYDYFVQELPTNSEQIEIEITEDMIPNMYLSVVVVDGAADFAPYINEETGEAIGLPSFKVGYASLPINNAEKELTISLTPNRDAGERYQPQETVLYDVAVTDHAGNPVQAEMSLALVDKAVLSLSPQPLGQLLETFWSNRGLGVRTGAGLTLAIDRINLALAPQAKGGGGGIEADFGDIRGDFRETALWVADFTTDEDGLGVVEATLPDNLTTWTLTGKAVTAEETLVGEAQVDILSSKPLLVRPVAPRFLVLGDEAQMGLIIQNNSNEAQLVEAAFEAVVSPSTSSDSGNAITVEPLSDTSLTVEAGQRVRLDYLVSVSNADLTGLRDLSGLADGLHLNLTMGARSAELSDALTFDIPVYPATTPETVATSGVVDESGLRTEIIALPYRSDDETDLPAQGSLTVNLDHSLAAGMRDGLDYLEHYRYECTEQTVSRFLPNVLTYRAYQQLNLDNPELADKLPGLVSLGLQRLYNHQKIDGGWGWFIRDESDPFLTAYVLLSLIEAQRAGFAVESAVIDEAATYLQESLIPALDVAAHWQANRQAFVLYVLAEAGYGDMGRAKALFEQREQLDYFGRAFLALAMQLMDEETREIDTLISDLTDGAIISATGAHWEEAQVDYYAMNTDTRSTAVIIAVLSRIDSDHPLLPQAVRWLMSVREHGGHWETTQESAWAIIGLTDWLIVTGELQADYGWQLSLNGESLGEGAVDAENIDQTTQLQVEVSDLLVETANRLVFELSPPSVPPSGGEAPSQLPPTGGEVKGGQGRLYYAAFLEYYQPVEEVRPLDRGIIVSRQYRLAPEGIDDEPSNNLINEATVGDTIEVKLTLVAPNDLHYVVVEDPIPAGTEGIDTSLATTSVVGQAPSLDRTDRRSPWGWWYFSHSELRDDKAVLFATYLPKGTYEYTYYIRASVAGEYRVRPTHAEQMYFPEVFGRGEGSRFVVTRE